MCYRLRLASGFADAQLDSRCGRRMPIHWWYKMLSMSHMCMILQLTALHHRCDALRSSTPRTAAASPCTASSCTAAALTSPAAKPRSSRRGSVGAAAAALVAWPRASQALGVKDGLLDRCPETPSCISSQDDAARGGRSFRPPWAYDDTEWTVARDKLTIALVALGTSADGEPVINGRYLRCGDLEFYFTENDSTVQFRGDGRDVDKRLAKLRIQCGFEEIVVLRNRRRAFGVGESALDSFGPSFFDTGDSALLAPDALKTRDPDPMAPEAFPLPDKATRKWLREKRAEAM